MKHKEILSKIGALLDGEVKAEQKDEIMQHISTCQECSNEYKSLLELDANMKNLTDLNPPLYFREKLDRKIKENKVSTFEFNILKLIPTSAVLAAFVLFVSTFIIVSPYIYATDSQDLPKQVVNSIKSAVVTCMTASVFSPAAFAAFCDSCSMNMCECCKTKDKNYVCHCGGPKHGK